MWFWRFLLIAQGRLAGNHLEHTVAKYVNKADEVYKVVRPRLEVWSGNQGGGNGPSERPQSEDAGEECICARADIHTCNQTNAMSMWRPVTSTNIPLLVQDSTLAFHWLFKNSCRSAGARKHPPPPRCVTTADWDPLWHSSQTNFQSINTGQTPQLPEETLFPSLHRQWMLVVYDSLTSVNQTFSWMTYHKSYWQLTDNEISPLYFSIGRQPNFDQPARRGDYFNSSY